MFRFYVFPYVLAGLIPPLKLAELWETLQYRLYKPPPGVSKETLSVIVPQVDWMYELTRVAERVQKRIPIQGTRDIDAIRMDIKPGN